MKISIRALSGSIEKYRKRLEKHFDYKKHYNIYHTKTLMRGNYNFDELKDVEIETVEELFTAFKEFDGFSYDDCQIAIDVADNIVYIFDRYVE
ncbi:hypothetical protein [Bacillus phage vB_BanS-Thrax4]|nr:hypothetical protein [Bacillus phage vB_BanS-Thrax4]